MADTMPVPSTYGKSGHRGQGAQAVQRAFGAASAGSAQKQIQRGFEKAERVAQLLALNGATLPIVAHVSRLTEILESGPVLEITQAFRIVGSVDRAEDESREACLTGSCTGAELDLQESRLLRQIDQSYAALRSVRAHRRVHG